jgi:hypothetical protein
MRQGKEGGLTTDTECYQQGDIWKGTDDFFKRKFDADLEDNRERGRDDKSGNEEEW